MSEQHAEEEPERVVVMQVEEEEAEAAPAAPTQVSEEEEEARADEEEEARAEEEEGDDDDILTGPCPGGPEDLRLIPSFKTHVAFQIWNEIERPLLRCWCHTTKMEAWKFGAGGNEFKMLIHQSKIPDLRWISYKTPNKNLICAFVERWQPETNSFHMPFGEMTITLDDVFCLTGLPVSGLPVVAPEAGRGPEAPKKMISRLLGVSEMEAVDALQGQRGSSVRLEWLRSRFTGDVTSTSERKRRCAARAYLWFVLGCTIFADKSGTRVDTKNSQSSGDGQPCPRVCLGSSCSSILV